MAEGLISEDDGVQLPDWTPPEIDRGKAHPARIYDYLLGGNSLYSQSIAVNR